MVRGVREVDDVDDTESSVEQRNVVVGDLSATLLDEHLPVAQVLSGLPYTRDDFRRLLKGVHLVRDAEILVPDHVPENAVERFVAGRRQVGGEVLRADENIDFRWAELSVVLAIGEEEIDADVGLFFLHHIRQGEAHADAGSTVSYTHLTLPTNREE